jgi:branched-chain amino acid transport system substrate-binding protein
MYGMAAAFTMVDTLKRAGRRLTRPGVMRAATNLNEHNNPFLLPGISVRTTPANRFPILKAQLVRWDKTHWVPFGGLVDARG